MSVQVALKHLKGLYNLQSGMDDSENFFESCGLSRHFMAYLYANACGRRLFVTKRSSLVGMTAAEDDNLVLPRGPTPPSEIYVLRRYKDRNVHEFVGECLIHSDSGGEDLVALFDLARTHRSAIV